MKSIGVRALRENPGVLSQSAKKGEYVLITNRSNPVSLSVPFTDKLIEVGVHISLAVKLYEEQVLTLSKAATLASMSSEAFLAELALLGVVVADQSPEELSADLSVLDA